MRHTLTAVIVSAALLAAGAALSSCMKDEPLNAECDIVQATLHSPAPEQLFYNLSDSVKNVLFTDSVISFSVRRGARVSNVSPEFKLTQGATIEQTGGALDDATSSGNMTYRVTSQDGNWHRRYTLQVTPVVHTVSDTLSEDFEHYELNPQGKYYLWHDQKEDGTLANDWATGNPGFQISMGSALPEAYPTAPMANGLDGAAVCLTTRDTGPFGVMANKRIAAGNLFLGEFDVVNALRDAMQATRFGIPFDMRPVKFTGYYKYTPGERFQDKNGNTVAGRVDSAAIYSVFYLNHDAAGNSVMLHGDDVQTNPNIVAIAKVTPVTPTREWTPFEVEFVYNREVDMNLLENMGYNLTIVFSSSADGDTFQGAIGSELCIDHVRLVCSKEE